MSLLKILSSHPGAMRVSVFFIKVLENLTGMYESSKLKEIFHGPLAQLVEQRTLNPRVVGSSPTRVSPFFPLEIH